ncbi:DegV family protein, partial [Mycoplasmopsis pullorum]
EIDNEIFFDGIDQPVKMLNKLENASQIKTSLPNIDEMENIINHFAQEYDDVLVLLLSAELSSTTSYAKTIAKEYANVHVVDNSFVGEQYLQVVQLAQQMYHDGANIEKICQKIQELSDESLIYIVPKNLDFMIKGGRLSAAKKFIMQKIPMIPVLKFAGSVNVSALKRTLKGAIQKMFEKIIKKIDGVENVYNYSFRLIHGLDEEINKLVLEIAQSFNISFESQQYTSTAVAIHCGPSAISVTVLPKNN